MSTEVKNTLFRFVTMRAPELSDEKDKGKRFIYRSDVKPDSRPFDKAVKERVSVTKWSAMQNCTFTPTTEDYLKVTFPEIYNLGVWISRNKYSFLTNELTIEIEKVSKSFNPVELDFLWNNLFYQVVTQKDFYVKEIVIQLLIANHVYINLPIIHAEVDLVDSKKMAFPDTIPVYETEYIKLIVNAKVVLPKELFIEEDITTTDNIAAKGAKEEDLNDAIMSLPSPEMMRSQALDEANTNIDNFKQLKKELEKAEKKYRREYQLAYDKALKEYQSKIEPILDRYNQDVIDSKQKWCSTRDPNSLYDVNDPCDQPPIIAQPKLPDFDFTFIEEMDLMFLNTFLTDRSFTTLVELLEIDPEQAKQISTASKVELIASSEGSGSGTTYSSTNTQISDTIGSNTQVVLNNTPSQGATATSVNGVIIPNAIIPSSSVPFSYQVCPKATGTSQMSFFLTIEVPDNTWNINESSSNYVLATIFGVEGLYFVSRNNNTITLKTQVGYPISNANTSFIFKGDIGFTNGVIKSFAVQSTAQGSLFRSCFSGTLADKFTPANNPANTPSTNNPIIPKSNQTFIPNGFGVKQLGIADYKKIEQTVQGYIEGEVSHIENVMARERREKSTRKLNKSEITDTLTTDIEKEQTTDTSSTNRYEMQTEVAKVLQESKDQNVSAHVDGSYGSINFGVAGSLATHSSKEENTKQAMTQAQEVTEKATNRITTKVRQERVTKMLEEFEENNIHEFDNRKGDKHVVGVYRWVDKVYKNQILNFGKRLMFEFMIPEPSKLHLLGMTANQNINGTLLEKPVDPRLYVDPAGTSISLNLKDFSRVNTNTINYWGGLFNVEFATAPKQTIYIGKTFSYMATEVEDNNHERAAASYELEIPEGYQTIAASAKSTRSGDDYVSLASVIVGSLTMTVNEVNIPSFTNKIPVSYSQLGSLSSSVNISIKCQLTDEYYKKWQQDSYKAILDAYEKALADYNNKIAEEEAKAQKIKTENPGFYRQIENLILRKNCISYIIDQTPTAKRTYGRNMFKALTPASTKRNFGNHEVDVNADLDDYAAFAKFIEEAFEWSIMSYNFYPYYWGDRNDWSQLYQYDNNDPLFRNFMQAGMARVIVTVRPGFEEAVRFYMQTGQIWNGGEVPVIDDKLFMSIVDELREPVGKKEGKAWPTRLPTALTILQAQTIGLNVTKALPFDDNLTDFEDPTAVPRSAALEIWHTQMGGVSQTAITGTIYGKITGNDNVNSEIMLRRIDLSPQDFTSCDVNGHWSIENVPVGKYQINLDENDDFKDTEFNIVEGTKVIVVEVVENQSVEVNLTVHRL